MVYITFCNIYLLPEVAFSRETLCPIEFCKISPSKKEKKNKQTKKKHMQILFARILQILRANIYVLTQLIKYLIWAGLPQPMCCTIFFPFQDTSPSNNFF